MEKAIELLRTKGLAQAAKGFPVGQRGLVSSYIHMGGRIGVLIEVNCETDFVAKTEGLSLSVMTWPCRSPPPNRNM